MVARTLDAWGRVDILVNNAGINIRGPIEQLQEATGTRSWTRTSRAPGSAAGPWPRR
jgi:NADP-dependent 3-hydroxy acid dehydrogenase YdfG